MSWEKYVLGDGGATIDSGKICDLKNNVCEGIAN